MAANTETPWYLWKPKGWAHFQAVPLKRLRVLLLAAFVLFSTWGLFGDLIGGGHDPYPIVLINMAFSGAIAVLWILSTARLPLAFLIVPALIQTAVTHTLGWFDHVVARYFALKSVDGTTGIQGCSIAMMAAIVTSYIFFITFIRLEGKESFKLRNELELAHGIQKTLVPPFTLRGPRFEIYGISKPSEKVGGDLVDAVELPGGDAIAYVSDVAGHGLQAGILMGMLKTAMRTALFEAEESESARTLPLLLERLNAVLPSVKEPHMYATFSGFRLCADGQVYFALAASTPVLHWHANGLAVSKLEEEQFPLGLLPVREFDGSRLQMGSGDLLVVATDGILEACDKSGDEFGVERLEQTIAANAHAALPEMAERILGGARAFGRQIDDQTILLIRCLA
jgi:serine phosphatase RsbU (regulator of sigma subunit)